MKLEHVFRAFLILFLIFGIAAASVDSLFTNLLSPSLTDALEKEPPLSARDTHPAIIAILISWFVLSLAALVGIFLFRGWGRSVSLYTTILGFFIVPLFGSCVSSGISCALNEASVTLWGVALSMSYFSPLAARFQTA